MNTHQMIIALINTDSVRNNFDALISEIQGILTNWWYLGFNSTIATYRLGRNGIPSKLIATEFSSREDFSVEINLRKKIWLLCFSYNQQNITIITHIEKIGKVKLTLRKVRKLHLDQWLQSNWICHLSRNILWYLQL